MEKLSETSYLYILCNSLPTTTAPYSRIILLPSVHFLREPALLAEIFLENPPRRKRQRRSIGAKPLAADLSRTLSK